jgi:hypothetical protein
MNCSVLSQACMSSTWVGRARGGTSRVTASPNAMVVVTAWLRWAAWARIQPADDIGAA